MVTDELLLLLQVPQPIFFSGLLFPCHLCLLRFCADYLSHVVIIGPDLARKRDGRGERVRGKRE